MNATTYNTTIAAGVLSLSAGAWGQFGAAVGAMALGALLIGLSVVALVLTTRRGGG